eukprot:9325505-Pyramimonas_sp.AAC.1
MGASSTCTEQGLHHDRIMGGIAMPSVRQPTPADLGQVRRQYQKYIDEALVGSIGNEVHIRMRHKLNRWGIRLFPR